MLSKKKEWIPVGVMFLVLAALFSYSRVVVWNRAQGDTALYSQLFRNVITKGAPSTEIGANTLYYLFPVNKAGMTFEEIRNLDLSAPTGDKLLKNYFTFHNYPFLFALTPLRWIDTDISYPVVIVLSFFSMLFVCYYKLRENGVPVSTASLFVLLAASHPAFSISIYGQLYPDRFFLALAAGLAFLCSNPKRNRWVFLLLAVLCWLVNERAGLIIGVFLVLHYVLYFRKNEGSERIKLYTGIVSIAASGILMKTFMNNSYYGSYLITSIPAYLGYLQGPGVMEKIGVFLFFNGILLFFCLRDWRALIIGVIMLFPNLFGNIGGAEKTGWLTHYHTYYFPFLLWAAATGITTLCRKHKNWMVNAALCLMIALIGLKNPYARGFSFSQYKGHMLSVGINDFITYFVDGNARSILSVKKEFRNSVVPGSRVSAVESAWYPFYKTAHISYYPIGLKEADYVVVGAQKIDRGYKYGGFISYYGPAVGGQIDDYLAGKMKEYGYDLENPVYVSPWGHAVIGKRGRK